MHTYAVTCSSYGHISYYVAGKYSLICIAIIALLIKYIASNCILTYKATYIVTVGIKTLTFVSTCTTN